MLKYFEKYLKGESFDSLFADNDNGGGGECILAQEEKKCCCVIDRQCALSATKSHSIDSASCFLSIVRTAVQFAFLSLAVTFFLSLFLGPMALRPVPNFFSS
jgi:hypothetical protein